MRTFLLRRPLLRFLMTVASWLVAVPCVAATCFLLAQILMTVCSERVYEINPAEPVRTELDGKLVKLLADEVRSGSEPLELEAFVHGAMCMSYSGRCMISSYLVNRSGNRGGCAQPCRWKYFITEEKRIGHAGKPLKEGAAMAIVANKAEGFAVLLN